MIKCSNFAIVSVVLMVKLLTYNFLCASLGEICEIWHAGELF